jgi:hypothetical protein
MIADHGNSEAFLQDARNDGLAAVPTTASSKLMYVNICQYAWLSCHAASPCPQEERQIKEKYGKDHLRVEA